MKALIFIPKIYSYAVMLANGFIENGWDAKIIDYKDLLQNWENQFYERTIGLPKRLTHRIRQIYLNQINKYYLEIIKSERPEIVFIYNNQFFYPETLAQIKSISKIVFLLGDNPLYSSTFDYNLTILEFADLIISPDSHWEKELSFMGHSNIYIDYIGYLQNNFYPTSYIPPEIKSKYKSDALFIGTNYNEAAGYKKAKFLNSFSNLDFKLFGTKEWLKWIDFFPNLKKHFILLKNRISNEELNLALNCTKIYPVEQNPWIINGIHIRVFESIGSGVLPLVEWRKDLDQIFKGMIPAIKSYNDAQSLAEYFINNEKERLNLTYELMRFVNSTYTPKLFIRRIINKIY